MQYSVIRDKDGKITNVQTSLRGDALLGNNRINKDTAFTAKEREELGLLGKLPPKIDTLEEQAERCYAQFKEQKDNVAKYVYLNELHNHNETLFYKLVEDHLSEMMPIVYTPTVGAAIQQFSQIYQRPSGLTISYNDKDKITEILDQYDTSDIDIIVVTDSEAILGIGDQGVGGIYIAVGKLAVYTLCANLDPHRVLPIVLDVGTNNEDMLKDPMYLGWQHERVRGKDYDDFIDTFVAAVHKKFPNIYLHWEDFAKDTARSNLERYQDKMCTFNDDMQGTGIVTLSALLSASVASNQKLTDHQIVFLGAGTSSTGIADQICDAMVLEGLSLEEARSRVWILSRKGLLTERIDGLADFQKIYVKNEEQIADWDVADKNHIELLEVVKNLKPTVLIGVSTVGGAFNKEIVQEMAKHVERPIIFPISNPTSCSEAIPEDLLKWTDNKALITTGSPFDPVDIGGGKQMVISQCNNAFAFPGLGLGIIASRAKRVTSGMIWAACKALTDCSPVKINPNGQLLPNLDEVKDVSFKVAKAVMTQAVEEGVAEPVADIDAAIRAITWEPKYYPYTK